MEEERVSTRNIKTIFLRIYSAPVKFFSYDGIIDKIISIIFILHGDPKKKLKHRMYLVYIRKSKFGI